MAKILVLYHSQQYGNTHIMAEAVADGVREAGGEPTLVNTNETRLEIKAYAAFDALAAGSPDYYSYIAGGLKVFLDDWYIAKQASEQNLTGKPVGLFYSYGGGGRVKEPLERLFAIVGNVVGETVESKGKPDEAVLVACRELGRVLVEAASK